MTGMDEAKNEMVPCRRISSGEGQWFYGYYDNPAWSDDDRLHLCTRTPFWLRLPVRGERADLGFYDLQSGTFTELATTAAWNFQQGAMLQWHPANPGREILYNVHDEAGYRCAIMDVTARTVRHLDAPLANVDPAGRFGLSINFDRLLEFRPGYGYCCGQGARMAENHPSDDGVCRVDLDSGRSELILSLDEIWRFCGGYFRGVDQKIVVNHITFNSRGTRFVFLARNFPDAAAGTRWLTAILTADCDGGDLRLLSDFGYASHYNWRDERIVAFHCDGPEGRQLYEIDDATGALTVLDRAFFTQDGHCSYSPDRAWMLYDSYPDKESYRHLYLYHLTKRRGTRLGSYYSVPQCTGDFRCDLHPRWSRSGTVVSFDSVHEGSRHLYAMDLRAPMEALS